MGTKTVADKLLIKPHSTVWVSDTARLPLLEPLPTGAHRVDAPELATTALVFADDAASLRAILATYGTRLSQPPIFWVAYPKGNRTDVNRDSLWPILVDHGMRPISQVAVDEVWSALRFRPLKEGEEFAAGHAG